MGSPSVRARCRRGRRRSGIPWAYDLGEGATTDAPQGQGMSTEVMNTVLRSGPAARSGARRLRLEHVIMAGAILSLIILVVLPLLWLFYGSLRGEQGLSLDHFSEVLSGRLY